LCVRPLVAQEHAGESKTGRYGKNIAKRMAGIQLIGKEQEHTQNRDRNSQGFTEPWLFPVERELYHENEDRRRKLEQDGSRRCCILVRKNEQDSRDGKKYRGKYIAFSQLNFETSAENGEDKRSQHCAQADDAHGIPWYEFDAQAAKAPA